jgi:branched-chain amino acid transport system substrate-binding protein
MRARITDVRRVNDLESHSPLRLDRRRALKLFAATGAAGAIAPALAACSPAATQARAAQTLRVGFIVPLSGPLQDVGFEMHNGFNLFLQVNNNQIGGMTVAVNVIDEGASSASGIVAARAALKSGSYDVLVGIANSQVMAAIPDNVTAARIPLVGSNGSPAGMRSSPFVWRTSFVTGEASTALAAFLTSVPAGTAQHGELNRPRSVVVYSDGSADAVVEAKAFTDTVGATNISIHSVTNSSPSGVMHQIRSWNADLVFAAASPANAAQFISDYQALKMRAPLCGPGSLTEINTLPASATGVFTSMNYAPGLDNSANETFVSAYFAQFSGKVPTSYAMASYDAANVLDSAINGITDQVTSDEINAKLGLPQSFDSPRGRWQFNQSRTPLQGWYLRQVRLDGTLTDNVVLADLETLT